MSETKTDVDLTDRPDATECACGTAIPARGTDFDPGCRHCERALVNRLVAGGDA